MATQKEIMQSESSHKQHGQLKYKASFLTKSKDVDECIESANREDADMMDDTDLARITTGWMHRILHYVGTLHYRKSHKTDLYFQPKFG